MVRTRGETLGRSLRRKLHFITACSPYCKGRGKTEEHRRIFRDDTTMPSRKFSVNSQFSSSSVKTSGSSGNEIIAYRKAASVHEINALYAALNELIHSPPTQPRRNTGGSVTSGKSGWSSDSNLLESEASRKIFPKRANSEASSMRPSRSVSCLSSKSCYASICTHEAQTPAAQMLAAQEGDSQKHNGLYSKLVARIRGKKSAGGKRGNSNQKMRRSSSVDPKVCMIDGRPVKSIEDLIELANAQKSSGGAKCNAKDKRKRFKVQGRSKANSFDSSESNSLGICVHKVSSKLRTWYTRAASLAATIEDEARSRAESSITASSENVLDDSQLEMVACEDERAVADFDVSTGKVLENEVDDPINKTATEIVPPETGVKNRLPRIDLLLKRSYSSYDSTDEVFLQDKGHADKCAENTRWRSDNRCDLIRRLSLNIVEDVLAGKSVSCGHISKFGRAKLHYDVGSTQKVQQWLKDLDRGEVLKISQGGKAGKDVSSDTAEEIFHKLIDKSQDSKTPKGSDVDQSKSSESAEVKVQQKQSQPLFYIPNFKNSGSDSSVDMVVRF